MRNRISRVTNTKVIPRSIPIKLAKLKTTFYDRKSEEIVNIDSIHKKTVNKKPVKSKLSKNTTIKASKSKERNQKRFSHPEIVIEEKGKVNTGLTEFFCNYRRPFESRQASSILKSSVKFCANITPHYKQIVIEKQAKLFNQTKNQI